MNEVAEICNRLSYDPLTGILTRLYQPDVPTKINTRFAGKPTGTDNGHGYIVITVLSKSYLAHRLAWLMVHGSFPKRLIDHKNGNGFDNRIANLRVVDAAQSVWNRGIFKNNTSGCKGVRRVKDGRWRAIIEVYGKTINLGRFVEFDAAASVRRQAESASRSPVARWTS